MVILLKKNIDDFLFKQKEYELLKVKQVKKKQIGHITAFTYKENGQMDIYDISKYSKPIRIINIY